MKRYSTPYPTISTLHSSAQEVDITRKWTTERFTSDCPVEVSRQVRCLHTQHAHFPAHWAKRNTAMKQE